MYEERIGWPPGVWWVMGSLIALAIVGGVGSLLTAPAGGGLAALPFLIIGGFLVGIGVAFRHLRIVVDAATLTVGFGPFRDQLPLARIVAHGPTTYRWQEYGGWGIRYNVRHPRQRVKLFNVLGDGGQAVEVVLDDGRRLLFSSRDPAAVCQAIGTSRQ